MLDAAVERREYERQMIAWHAVVIVNGVGMRRKALKVSDLIPAKHGAGVSDGQGPESHRHVMAILKKVSN